MVVFFSLFFRSIVSTTGKEEEDDSSDDDEEDEDFDGETSDSSDDAPEGIWRQKIFVKAFLKPYTKFSCWRRGRR